MQAKPPAQNLQELQQKVEFAEHVKRITSQIHAASNLDQILLDLHKDILGLFDAEDLTLFAFDAEKKEIFYKVPHIDTIEEVRIPITEQSLAGFCAKYLRPVNIADAYNTLELQSIHPSLNHDTSYDKRTGFKTKQVLTYPIVADNKYLMGVLQLLNKKSGSRFTRKDEESVAEIAKALGRPKQFVSLYAAYSEMEPYLREAIDKAPIRVLYDLHRAARKHPLEVRSFVSGLGERGVTLAEGTKFVASLKAPPESGMLSGTAAPARASIEPAPAKKPGRAGRSLPSFQASPFKVMVGTRSARLVLPDRVRVVFDDGGEDEVASADLSFD